MCGENVCYNKKKMSVLFFFNVLDLVRGTTTIKGAAWALLSEWSYTEEVTAIKHQNILVFL